MDFKMYQKQQSVECKNGIYFILAASVTWALITILWLLDLDAKTKAYLMFYAGGIMFPLAFLFSKIVKAKWNVEGNPLSTLGIYLSTGQVLFFPMIIWA